MRHDLYVRCNTHTFPPKFSKSSNYYGIDSYDCIFNCYAILAFCMPKQIPITIGQFKNFICSDELIHQYWLSYVRYNVFRRFESITFWKLIAKCFVDKMFPFHIFSFILYLELSYKEYEV